MSSFADIVNRSLLAPKQIPIEDFAAACGKDLYPRQALLLKIIHLEELTNQEEDMLSDWIKGGMNNEVQISPNIRERMDFLREMGYKHFREVYLVGGRRSGKGFMTALTICKKIAEALALGDPAAHYGLSKNKEIYFTCVAASLEQAQKYQFADIRETAAACKFLAPFIPALNEESFTIVTDADRQHYQELTRKGVKVNANMASLRVRPLAAQAGTIRGSASMAIVFDEIAHMIGVDGKASAEEVYKAATPATKTFGPDSIIFCNSSPWTMVGQFFELVENSLAVDEDGTSKYPNIMSIRFPSWEMFRGYELDKRKRFHSQGALIVSPDWPEEMLITKMDKAKKYEERLEEMKDPDSYRVEIRSQWAAVTDSFLNPENVDRAFNEFYLNRKISENLQGSYLHHFYMHCDPASTTDGFGMAVGHVEEFASEYHEGEMAKHVIIDLVHKWDPKDFPNHTIDYETVQEDLFRYIQLLYPDNVSLDQFNATPLSQWLQRKIRGAGMSTMVGVLHHTQKQNWQMWSDVRTAMNLNLLHIPDDCAYSEMAKLELKFLEVRNGNRVDHQVTGPVRTSDIATSIAVVTSKLLGAYIQNWSAMSLGELAPAMGSQGGYRIGGMNPDMAPNRSSIENLKSIYGRKYNNVGATRGIRPR